MRSRKNVSIAKAKKAISDCKKPIRCSSGRDAVTPENVCILERPLVRPRELVLVSQLKQHDHLV